MGDVQTRYGKVHYETTGSPGAIGPLVMLHGAGMAGSSYNRVVKDLAKATQVVVIDTVGHGQSGHPEGDDPFSCDMLADAVLDVVNELGFDKINLLGNSLGAMTGVEFAAVYPERVRKLVLVGCPGWDGRVREERTARNANMPRPDPSIPLKPADLAAQFTAPDEQLAADVTEARRNNAPSSRKTSAAVMGHDTLGRSFNVTAPTLLLCGERDIVVPDQPKFLRSIVGSKYVQFDNAGHYPQIDNPPLFTSTVLEFLLD